MKFYAIVGQGPWQEIVVTKEPYADDRTNWGMQTVSQEPTGVVYPTWRAAIRALDEKNGAARR